MAESQTVDADLPCFRCGYNLRTLRTNGRCPECGTEVDDSIAAAHGVNEPADQPEPVNPRRVYEPIAASIAYPVDAVMFVHAAMNLAARSRWRDAGGTTHVTARDVCKAVRSYALWYFNDKAEALDLLAEWKIGSSEDVGRIVYAMVAAGMLRISPDDAQSDFDHLFVLGRLFDEDAGL